MINIDLFKRKAKCQHCGAEATTAGELKHREGCLFYDFIMLLANLDDIVNVFGREKLEAYRLLKSVDRMYEILNKRVGIRPEK